MKIESSQSIRLDIRSDLSELAIRIKSKLHVLLFAFTLVWFGGWTVAGYFASGMFLGAIGEGGIFSFILFWLCLWLVGWLMAANSLIWQLFGIETIKSTRDVLSLKRTALLPLRTRNYELKSIRNVRSDVMRDSPFGGSKHPFWPGARGSVAFDYGSKTIRFGDELDDAETDAVVDAMNNHRKRWGN